ncbi:MAG: hypothetical protein G3W58_16470 [Pantoea ananatis]|nr:hypothetical protein [Pantoea ananatis]
MKDKDFPLVRIQTKGSIEIRQIQYKNNIVEQIYRENGNILPKIPLRGHLIDQVRAMQLIHKDLRNVISWIDMIREIANKLDLLGHFQEPDIAKNIILKSLFISILTTYGKCFTEAKARKFSLNKSNIPAEYKELHRELIEARHNFAAHKGNEELDDCLLDLVIYGPKKNRACEIFTSLRQVNSNVSDDWLNELEILLRVLMDHVKTKWQRIIKKIYEEKIIPHGLDYWVKRNGKVTSLD